MSVGHALPLPAQCLDDDGKSGCLKSRNQGMLQFSRRCAELQSWLSTQKCSASIHVCALAFRRHLPQTCGQTSSSHFMTLARVYLKVRPSAKVQTVPFFILCYLNHMPLKFPPSSQYYIWFLLHVDKVWVDIWRVNGIFLFGIIDVYSFFSLRYKNA